MPAITMAAVPLIGRFCAAVARARCSAMISGGISRMTSMMPNGSKITSSTKPRNEIRDQIDRREAVARDHHGKGLRVPGDAGVSAGEIERVYVALDDPRPVFQTIGHFGYLTGALNSACLTTAPMSSPISHVSGSAGSHARAAVGLARIDLRPWLRGSETWRCPTC